MKNKNINEQINRIKSLFNDERLYGNLSEQNTKFSLPTDEQLSKFLSDENRKKYINSSLFYKNYIEALDNWAKVSKDFGWTKSSNTVMSGEDFISTLSQGNTVDPNVCVNPTYFLERQFEHIKEMSEMDFDGTKEFLGSIGIDSRILYEQNMTYTWDSDPKVSVDSKLSTGDFSSNYTLPSTTNDLGKYYTLKNDKKWEYKYYEDDNTWYTRKKGTNDNWKKIKNEKAIEKLESELLGITDFTKIKDRFLESQRYLEEVINPQNVLISLQNKDLLSRLCKKVPLSTETIYTPNPFNPGSKEEKGVYGSFVSMNKICEKFGGVFLYPSIGDYKGYGLSNQYEVGFLGNIGFCGCVKHKGKVKVTKPFKGEKFEKTFDLSKFGDIQNWYDTRDFITKSSEIVEECYKDWHCLADIASIGVSYFGFIGDILSGLIDLVSAIGYVVERGEGWKLNAALTLIGTFSSAGEALLLTKKGNKFLGKIEGLNKILFDPSLSNIQKQRDIIKWSKSLTNDELKMYKTYEKFLTKMGDKETQKVLKNIIEQQKKLTNTENGVFKKMLEDYKNNPKALRELFESSGKDIRKTILKYDKSLAQPIIQGGIFGLTFFSQIPILKFLHNVYKKHGLDVFGMFKGADKDRFDLNQKKLEILSINLQHIYNDGKEDDIKQSEDVFEYLITPKKIETVTVLDRLLDKIKNTSEKDGCPDKMDKMEDLEKKVLEKSNYVGFDQTKLDKIYNCITIDGKSMYELDLCNDYIYNKINECFDKLNLEKTADSDLEDYLKSLENNSEIKNDSMDINEEIKRIKSLFNDDRLYGNLINEQCSEEDAKKVLKDKGYVISSGDDNTLPCLDPNKSEIGKVYKIINDNYKGKVFLDSFKPKEGGCGLSLYKKDKNLYPDNFIRLNLFEYGGRNRFALYYEYKTSSGCEKKDSGGNLEFSPTFITDLTSTTKRFGLGIKYSKIEGDWLIKNNDVIFNGLTHLKTMNSKLNTITSDNIADLVKTAFGKNTTLITFKDSNGNCNTNPKGSYNGLTPEEVIENKLSLTGTHKLNEIINLLS